MSTKVAGKGHDDNHVDHHSDDEPEMNPTLLKALEEVRRAEDLEEKRRHEQQALEVSDIISTAASFYEKVRYLVDYREEHTIRRNATERILKRKLLIEGRAATGIQVIQELVEGKYIEKEKATESAINEVDAIISAYTKLIRESKVALSESKLLVSFAATEIDAALSPFQYHVDAATAQAMYDTVRPKISVPSLSKEILDLQLYCAVWRGLLKADNESLAYALWILSVPEWRTGKADISAVAKDARETIRSIKSAVKSELQWQLVLKTKNEAIYFQVIKELFLRKKSSAENVLAYPSKLDEFTEEFLEEKFESENLRIRKSGIRAVIYLLFTKLILVGILEWPYEAFIIGVVDYTPLAINAFFHPMLLLILTRKVGFPGKDNTEAVAEGVKHIARGEVRPIMVRSTSNGNVFIFSFVYLLMTIGVFGAITGILQSLNFNWLGASLFLFFLALVMYFAFRIRYRASQWRVMRDERPLAVLGAVLATPIVRVGRWLSRTFSSINFLVIVMDFILETPFKYLLDFSHQFLRYLREKADEVY